MAQTYTDFEIILVDDGSKDNSPKICDDYGEKYPEKIKVLHKTNSGPVDSCNKGLEIANGEYIAFIDSDDMVALNYFEKLVMPFMEDKDIDFTCMSCTRMSDGGVLSSHWRINMLDQGMYEPKTLYSRLLNDNGGFLRLVSNSRWGKIIKKDILLKALKYCDDKLSYAEDFQLTFIISTMADKFYIVDDYGYYYRSNPQSIVSKYRQDNWKKIKMFLNQIGHYTRDNCEFDFSRQLNTWYVLYADESVHHEIIHKVKGYKDNIRLIFNDKELLTAFQDYDTENMGRFDKMMSKQVKKKSIMGIRVVHLIDKVYHKIHK